VPTAPDDPTAAEPASYSFQRYLAAKESVDDRALHRPTLDSLAAGLAGPLELFEIGPGLGSMLRRLLAWDRLPATVRYVGVDARAANVTAARERTADWAAGAGWTVEGAGTAADPLRLADGDREATVEFATGDAFAALAGREPAPDLVVGCAVLDLFELDDALPALFDALAPGGLAYLPITFDGETVFRPVPDADRERRVLDAYHGTMDAPDRAGGSRTGRALFDAVPAAGGRVVAAGGSDWVVTPPYPADEAYFCHHVIDTVEGAVAATETRAADEVADWAHERHAAVAAGRLTYLTHQVDLLARAE
jgi:hypothetical protein